MRELRRFIRPNPHFFYTFSALKPLISAGCNNFSANAEKFPRSNKNTMEVIKIASPVVFKIRVYNAHIRANASKNRAHIYYIAKRPGVSLNAGMVHGLFGKLEGKDSGDISDIKAAADYVYQKSKTKTHMYINS